MGTNSKGETIPEPAGFTKSESKTYKKGVEYDIPSPFYSGYTASVERISGTMGDTNVAETVTYSCSHPTEPAAVIKQKGAWGHQWYCGQCGDLLGEEEHHTGTADYDYTKDGHTPHCSICDWKSPVEVAHKKLYSQVKVNGSQRHWVQCSVCNYEGYESHEWSKAEGYGDEGCFAKCVCGAFYSYPTHKFTKYESGPKGKHYRVCAICGVREEENCDTDGYRYKNSTEHEILCSKCNAVQGVENHGDAQICQHTAGSYHRTYCTKCNATTERNIPCTPSEMRKTDLQHFQTCIRCGYELECGNHRYPSTIYKVNQQADITSIDGKLVTYWTWDEVKRCSVCGNEMRVGHGNSLGNGGGGSATKGSKNFGGGGPGPKPQIASSDTKLEELAGQNLNTNVVSSIDEVVMNNYFDLVSENKCDVLDEIEENSAALGNADPQDVNVIVEPTVTVTPTAYSRNSKTLSIEIDATYNIVLENNNDKSKKVTVLNNEKIPVNEPVDLCILLPDGFGAEGKTVNIDHEHNGEIHHYSGTIVKDGNKYYLPFTATAGFSPFTFTLVEEQSEDDVASVTYSYATKNPAGTAVYKTAYFDSIESAFAATSEVDFEDQLTEEQHNRFDRYMAPELKLLKEVTISQNTPVMANAAGAAVLDLNGKTMTILKDGGLIGDGQLSLESTVSGNIISAGTIEVPLGMWTGDKVYITDGSVTGLSMDGGTLVISGGEVDFTEYSMINNGGDADIAVTISGAAKIRNLNYVVYLDEEGNIPEDKYNIHLTLNGGYYDVDPETYKTGSMGGPAYDQSAYVTYDEDKVEMYTEISPQADWAADPAIYKYRINGTPCAHAHTQTTNGLEANCQHDGYTGMVICLDCGMIISLGEALKGGHD
jgi:hypothetical protein